MPPLDDEEVVPPLVEEGVVPPVEEEEFVLPAAEPVDDEFVFPAPEPVDVVPPDGFVDAVGSALFVTAKTRNSGVDPELVPELLDAWGSRDCRSAYRLLLLDGVINVGVDIALSSKTVAALIVQP